MGNGNLSRHGGMLIYNCIHWFLFSNGWTPVTNTGHLEVQRYLMCKSVSSFVIAVARLQKLKAQEVHWFRLVFLWENALFLPTTYHVGFTISCAYPHHQIFVMLALWWMQVPLTIVRFSGFTKSPFSLPISYPWPPVTSGLGFDHLRHKLHSQLRHWGFPQLISGKKRWNMVTSGKTWWKMVKKYVELWPWHHRGPLFAIIAPIPFVWLKPDGTLRGSIQNACGGCSSCDRCDLYPLQNFLILQCSDCNFFHHTDQAFGHLHRGVGAVPGTILRLSNCEFISRPWSSWQKIGRIPGGARFTTSQEISLSRKLCLRVGLLKKREGRLVSGIYWNMTILLKIWCRHL